MTAETTPGRPAGTNAQAVTHLLECEMFSELDRHFGRFMGRLSGALNPEVMLAAALTSRSQGLGNICLDLRTMAGTSFPDDDSVAGPRIELPSLDAWVAALRRSPVVGRPTEFRPLVLDPSNRLYLHRYWQYESELAAAILDRAGQDVEGIDEARLAAGLERLFPPDSGANETDWQRVAVRTAVRKKFCAISGGPGTGKTRTVVALLMLLLDQAGKQPLRIALAAPTGKAAARLQEALKKWKTALPCDDAIPARLPEEAFTLHRLLGGSPDSAQFRYNARNPLPFDVVVVDEASMVDLAMMAKLFAATPPSARLVLVGDKDQLASVEAGAVMGEICAEGECHTATAGRGERPSPTTASSESLRASVASNAGRDSDVAAPEDGRIPSPSLAGCIVELRRNYRFGANNGILALSRAINEGDAERALSLLQARSDNRQAYEGISAGALPSPPKLKERLYSPVIEGFGKMLQEREPSAALAALNRFRLLCALRRGPFGVETLNRVVEDILSEAGLISPRQRWYPGRPVLVTRNDYSLRLYNGDVGIILSDAATGEPRAWFPGANNVPRSVPPVRLPEHETVFAMTVHKSQGSEFEEVLLLLPDRESPLLTRELLYTGVTRASRRMELWLTETVFRVAVSRQVERASGLREALWGPQSRRSCSAQVRSSG